MQGVTSTLNIHQISEAEWTQEATPCITLTNQGLHWDPNFSIYGEQEHACSDLFGGIMTRFSSAGKYTLIINQVTASTTVDAADLYSDVTNVNN